MKTTLLSAIAVLFLLTATAIAQPVGQPAPMRRPGSPPPGPPLDADSANYQIRVQWVGASGISNALQIVTAEGNFTVSSVQASTVKINNADIPITLNFRGDIEVLSLEKARVKIFLGRTLPYVTGTTITPSGPNSSYQQLQLGLDSTLVVTFGKPIVIQADEREEIILTVKRLDG